MPLTLETLRAPPEGLLREFMESMVRRLTSDVMLPSHLLGPAGVPPEPEARWGDVGLQWPARVRPTD